MSLWKSYNDWTLNSLSDFVFITAHRDFNLSGLYFSKAKRRKQVQIGIWHHEGETGV